MSMEHSTEAAIAQAEKDGFTVIRSDPYTLLLDMDWFDEKRFECMKKLVNQFYTIKSIEDWPSKSGKPGHLHIVIKVEKPMLILERIALQALLGSDPKREILSLQRANEMLEDVSLLFKPSTSPDYVRTD